MIRLLPFAFLFYASANVAFALEAQDPKSLCDRFVDVREQKNCEQVIKKETPDWYLAAACSHQFEDSLFYVCLAMGKKMAFAPVALEKCSSEELSDEARLQCVKMAQSNLTKSFQSRAPAARAPQRK